MFVSGPIFHFLKSTIWKSTKKSANFIQTELEIVYEWNRNNKLFLNVSKCRFVSFTHQKIECL